MSPVSPISAGPTFVWPCQIPVRRHRPADRGIAEEGRRRKAGDRGLQDEGADGSTVLTRIHHRQTPLLLMQGRVEAGVTWQSEAIFQEQIGPSDLPYRYPASLNTTAI